MFASYDLCSHIIYAVRSDHVGPKGIPQQDYIIK